jgi:CheY-like chemotaxis protein
MARRIIVVEDYEPLRRSLGALLSQAGYEVIEAWNGQVAMQQMLRQPADLVVTDMLMPEMEGAEVISSLRRIYPTVKIIAISGGGISPAENHLAIARALGAHKVLSKPLGLQDLLESVRGLVGAT